MTGFSAAPLVLTVLVVHACISHPPPDQPAKREAEIEGPAGVEEPTSAWRNFADRKIIFVVPGPIHLSELPEPPTEVPPGWDSLPANDLAAMEDDLGLPFHGSSRGTRCSDPWHVSRACAYVEEDQQGRALRSYRYDYVDAGPAVTSQNGPDGVVKTLESCCYDSVGRVAKRRTQAREYGPCSWLVETVTERYDERGELVFSSTLNEFEFNAGEVGVDVYQPIYESGRLAGVVSYNGGRDLYELRMTGIIRYRRDAGRFAGFDNFSADGQWRDSLVYTWSGDFVRRSWVYSNAKDTSFLPMNAEIFQRRGPGDYVQVFDGRETRWEYETADGIETVTKYVKDLIVERRRQVADGRNPPRTLTVEGRLPDVEGLVMIERWRWLEDRVIVERPDGRAVYLLDCAALPAIEDLIDPSCPPPRPIR